MKKQVVVIHGGDAFNTYEEFLAYLREREIRIEQSTVSDWKRNLAEDLGDIYEVIAPRMPNAQNAKYLEWKMWFDRHIPYIADENILIGHSLGGIFLAKYLSEEVFPKKIRATLLVAAPFNTSEENMLGDFIHEKDLSKLSEQGGEIFLYHSEDDVVVPFADLQKFETALPGAHIRAFKDRGHFNQEHFPEILEDIKNA